MIDSTDQLPPTDNDGYLLNLADWNPVVAGILARSESVQLTPAHWEIINLARLFYEEYDISPAMRPFVKYIKQNLGSEKGQSIYLLSLFPNSPAKLCAKIAGLPRPANCL